MGTTQSHSLSIRRIKEIPIESAQDLASSDLFTLGSSSSSSKEVAGKSQATNNDAQLTADNNEPGTSKIVVVNSPSQILNAQRHKRSHEPLPPRVLPLLSIEGHQIDPRRHPSEHQLNPTPWIECLTFLEQQFRNRADLVIARQSQLQDKIIQTEDFVARFTEAYVNDKHKAIAKIYDDSRKVDELYNMMNKCERLTDTCTETMNRLNSLLPPELALEKFS